VLKETQSLVVHNIVKKIFICALWDEGVVEHEQIDSQRIIWRIPLKTRFLSKNLTIQIIKYLEFTACCLWFYRKEKIDIVNCHSLAILPIGLLFKIIFGSKLVYDTHELETETNAAGGIRKKLSKWLEKRLIPYVDITIVVGESIADIYRDMYLIERPVVVLNCPKYQRVSKEHYFRDKFKIPDNATIYLYQGGFGRGRGIEIILEAFSKMEDSEKCIVVFMGYGELGKKIKKYAKRFDNIYCHEAVPPEELLYYTACADIGLSLIEKRCLSYYYSMPNKVFEYWMAGLPVIITDLYELKKHVISNEVGWVIEHETSEPLLKIITDMKSDEIRKYTKNTKKVVSQYNWENQEKRMINAYQEMLHKSGLS
jgi:glycosyltransferase involved in cell wall biosynthesis